MEQPETSDFGGDISILMGAWADCKISTVLEMSSSVSSSFITCIYKVWYFMSFTIIEYSERLPFLALKHHEVVQQRQKVNRSSPSSPSSSHLVTLKGIHFTWRMRLCLAPSFAKQIEPFLWKCWEGSLVNQPVHHHHNQNDTRISDHKSVNWFWIILQNNSRYVEIRTSMNSKSKNCWVFLGYVKLPEASHEIPMKSHLLKWTSFGRPAPPTPPDRRRSVATEPRSNPGWPKMGDMAGVLHLFIARI